MFVLPPLSIYWLLILKLSTSIKNKRANFILLIELAVEISINNLPLRLERFELSTKD